MENTTNTNVVNVINVENKENKVAKIRGRKPYFLIIPSNKSFTVNDIYVNNKEKYPSLVILSVRNHINQMIKNGELVPIKKEFNGKKGAPVKKYMNAKVYSNLCKKIKKQVIPVKNENELPIEIPIVNL